MQPKIGSRNQSYHNNVSKPHKNTLTPGQTSGSNDVHQEKQIKCHLQID